MRNPGEENAGSGDDFPGGINPRFDLKREGTGDAGRLSGEKTGGISGGNTGGKFILSKTRGV